MTNWRKTVAGFSETAENYAHTMAPSLRTMAVSVVQRAELKYGDRILDAGTGTGQGFGSGHGRLGGSSSKSPPKVRMGATNVTGRLPPEVIQRIVRQNFGRFRLCYENGLRNSPKLQGRVSVKFVIGKDGAVSSAIDGGSDLPDSGVVSCVIKAFQGLAFPQPEGGGVVVVVYPVIFSPGDDPAAKQPAPAPAPAPPPKPASPPPAPAKQP